MIYAQTSTAFDTLVEGFPTGLAGTVGVRIVDPTTGVVLLPRQTTGIIESIPGSGIYATTLTAPATLGEYAVGWDTGGTSPVHVAEELVVVASQPVPPSFPGGLGPRSGPCTPWVSGLTVAALPWVSKAATAYVTAGGTPEQVALVCQDSAAAASELLYELSGRTFTGGCGPVTIRPVARPTDVDSRAWAGRFATWSGSWGVCDASGIGYTGVASHFGCSNPPEIDLGAYPVLEIIQVKIDGVVIPSAEYELRDFRTLVRMRTSATAQPTEYYGWPTCQINDLPDTEPGTFSVTYNYGLLPPYSGIIAVKKLAEYLALPQLGDNTKYPQRVTNVSRQGVSAMVVDVMDIVKTGKTGIYEVDIFLRATNPNQLSRPSAVWSPDLGRPRRTP